MSAIFTCSIDDGHPSDLRMADMLDRHSLNATFYVPITNCEGYEVMTPVQMRNIARRFEIGSHTLDHRYLKDVPFGESHEQIMHGKTQLEDIVGRQVRGFCYPGGMYKKRDSDLVHACGFEYARTTMNLRLDVGYKRYEMPTTIQFYPHDRTVFLRNFVKSGNWPERLDALGMVLKHKKWIDRLYALFDYACVHKKVFHLWGHSWEIDELQAWGELDHFFRYVAERVAVDNRLSNGQLAERFPTQADFRLPNTRAIPVRI